LATAGAAVSFSGRVVIGPFLPFAKQLAPERWLGADLGESHLVDIGTHQSGRSLQGAHRYRLISFACAPTFLMENLSRQDCQIGWCRF